jgi:hypothetical protein
MTHDPTRDCEHGRLKGKCDVCDLQAEVLEQCRINGMSAEREDALRAELTRLKASIALDKKAENARELGLDYEPALMQQPATLDEMHAIGNGIMYGEQPAPVQEPVAKVYRHGESSNGTPWHGINWLDEGVNMPDGTLLYTAAQPVPVKTYSGGKPWPVQPKPWVGLTDEEVKHMLELFVIPPHHVEMVVRAIEAKLKEKNHG